MEKSPEAFRTISEVAELLDTPAHVLRFWESRFPQIRPVKRAGGRRYYRPADVALLAGIRLLLHDQGMTIRGVQKILREQGVRHVCDLGALPGESAMIDLGGDVIEAEAVVPDDSDHDAADAADDDTEIGVTRDLFDSLAPSAGDDRVIPWPGKAPVSGPVPDQPRDLLTSLLATSDPVLPAGTGGAAVVAGPGGGPLPQDGAAPGADGAGDDAMLPASGAALSEDVAASGLPDADPSQDLAASGAGHAGAIAAPPDEQPPTAEPQAPPSADDPSTTGPAPGAAQGPGADLPQPATAAPPAAVAGPADDPPQAAAAPDARALAVRLRQLPPGALADGAAVAGLARDLAALQARLRTAPSRDG